GWIVTKNKYLYSKMAAFKDYTTICSSAPSEILSIIALRNKNSLIDAHLSRIKRNLSLLDCFFADYEDMFEWIKPKAGTICFPKLKRNLNSRDFCQKAVTESGIMLLPSTVYNYDLSHFRLGFGRENFPEALIKFREYLKTQ
ncbi:MAG: aminotransferase, partial [Eubacteriaceae bacterium]